MLKVLRKWGMLHRELSATSADHRHHRTGRSGTWPETNGQETCCQCSTERAVNVQLHKQQLFQLQFIAGMYAPLAFITTRVIDDFERCFQCRSTSSSGSARSRRSAAHASYCCACCMLCVRCYIVRIVLRSVASCISYFRLGATLHTMLQHGTPC